MERTAFPRFLLDHGRGFIVASLNNHLVRLKVNNGKGDERLAPCKRNCPYRQKGYHIRPRIGQGPSFRLTRTGRLRYSHSSSRRGGAVTSDRSTFSGLSGIGSGSGFSTGRPRRCLGLAVAVIFHFSRSSNLPSAENLSDGGEFLRHVLVVPVEVRYEFTDLRDQLLPFRFACAR